MDSTIMGFEGRDEFRVQSLREFSEGTNARNNARKRRRQTTSSSRRTMPLSSSGVWWLLVLVISCIYTITTEGSSLPFGRISTSPSRKQQQKPKDASQRTTRHNLFAMPRAGASRAATFVGVPPAGGLGLEPLSYYLRVALAGGVAGATGSAVLYPIDSAKTLRQSDPGAYRSVKDALFQMLKSKHAIQRVYQGILPAALGAIPSSALYFGAYESSKVTLQRLLLKKPKGTETTTDYRKRLFVHGLAAASGNVISSFVFVPKEVIKQQLQIRSGEGVQTIGSIVRQKGLSGLYAGYGATLLRNIPSATIRFVLYEELKRLWASNEGEPRGKAKTVGTFLAGAVAGSTSSFVMTPIDVVKTRMATGSCPLGVKSCMVHVIQNVGWKGLYAGAGSRVLWSGAFSAIGFGTFELVKGCLGVSGSSNNDPKKEGSRVVPHQSPFDRGTTKPSISRAIAKA